MDRALFLEVLKDSYSAYYNIVPVADEDAPLAFRADYFSRDERYWLTKNITMWGNEKNEYAYIFAADSNSCGTIEVGYLNGNEEPILESRAGFDFLGIEWRIYTDYSVTLLNHRGFVKNADV